MEDAEIAESVRKKLFLINAFLHTGSLSSGGGSDAALKHAVTKHFLQAVILELLIKVFYELDQKKAAPFTHNLSKLYKELKGGTKSYLEEKYDEARERRRQQFSQVPDVQFHPFEKVFKNNDRTVKNFKYDAMGVDSNSSADPTFYSEIYAYIDQRLGNLRA